MIIRVNRTRLSKWDYSKDYKGRRYIQGYHKNYHWVFLHNISCIKTRIVIQITNVNTGKQSTFESELTGELISTIAERGIDGRKD